MDAAFDMDNDGYVSAWDCDDFNRNTYPGAPERCDGHDNNCNGLDDIEEGIIDRDGACHAGCTDNDGDGSRTCDDPPDCNDDDPAIHPEVDGEVPEDICDGQDNDCDGISDNDSDHDNDGVGACHDCDDDNPLVAEGFNEVCDGLDNDCNGAVDDGPICGRHGTCSDAGQCTWHFDADGDRVEHDGGYPGQNRWCADQDDPANFILVSAPARGTRDFPFGIFVATFTIRVSSNTQSWRDCGTAVRLRANDRDDDGSGTCRNCWFGGDVALVPRHFGSANTWEEHELRFSLGPERDGHLIEVVGLRGSCRDVEVCFGEIDIVQQ